MIKKEKGKFVLYSKDGNKKLGSFDSEKEAEDREKEIFAIKHSAFVKVSLYITKASQHEDGTKHWLATCSDTKKDKTEQATTLQLFNDWIERAETGNTVSWLPPPRTPFLGLSHYPDLDGYGEAGLTSKMFIQGNQFKARGTFHNDDNHPLGPALFEAVRQERALIEKGQTIEEPIRISAGWWDIAHRHGDFIFERKSLDDICSMCVNGAEDKFYYLKGQLDHYAATRVPTHPRTELSLEEKAMTTRKDDAKSIIDDPELIKELDKRAKALTGKSESELPDGMVTKGDEEESPDIEQMEEVERHLPFGGATSLGDAEAFLEAQEQVNQVYTEWSLFQTVMSNILDLSEPQEIKARVGGLIKEFSSRVEAIKASVEDVILLQPIEGDVMMAEQEQTPAVDVNLQSVVDEALKNPQLDRQQTSEVIQKAWETYAGIIKAQLDAKFPPDPGEAIQKAMTPLVEKLDLIITKMGVPQLAQVPAAPVQKSLMPDGTPIPTQLNQLPISPITGKPSALTAAVQRSTQAQ